MTPQTGMGLGYAAVDVSVRAPRVAVVVDVDSTEWMFTARVALRQCTATWGGAGFVLIPHRGGEVSSALLRAVRAYDPDYVATSRRSFTQQEFASPGQLKISSSDGGAPLTGHELAELLGRVGGQEAFDESSEQARQVVLLACSPHRMVLDVDDAEPEWDFDFAALGDDEPSGIGLASAKTAPGYADVPCLAAPPDWGGAVGLLAAARLGAMEAPTPDGNMQPAGTDMVVSWLNGMYPVAPSTATDLIHSPTDLGMSIPPGDLPPSWLHSKHGLVEVSQGSARLSPAVVVVGDGPDDFALWMLLDRLYGRAVWLHSDWFTGDETETDEQLARLFKLQSQGRRGIQVCTVTRPAAEVQVVVEGLRKAYDVAAKKVDDARRARITGSALTWPVRGTFTLAAANNYSTELPMPVIRDSNGGIQLATRPPAILMDQNPTSTLGGISWQIDLAIEGSTMPAGRGLGGHHLCAPDQDPDHTWVRASRTGIAWHAARYDMVMSGMAPDQQVARPKVRSLGLSEWVGAMASQRGLGVRYSEAGMRARLLEGLWGSRDLMLEDFAGPWGSVFERFGPSGAPGNKGTTSKFPNGGGVVISGHGAVMTFGGITQSWPDGTDPTATRRDLDRLVSARVLRRGLTLGCAECHKPAFTSIDDLGQRNTCSRCSAVTELEWSAWRSPVDEPMWFYDLHPVVRELVQGNGDAPLVTAHTLSAAGRQFVDVAEMELLEAGKPAAETDLLAHCDGALITGEVKTVNELHPKPSGRKDAARKRSLWADVVRADRIVLATTHPAWATSSIETMKATLSTYPWTPGHRPELLTMTNVGTDAVGSAIVDW